MAKIVSAADKNLTNLLESYVQSGHLNFLIGSGASMPAIGLAGDIESEIDELLTAGDSPAANLHALDFLTNLDETNEKIVSKAADADIDSTLSSYKDFLAIIDSLLFERKSPLLPRQANVFTTNYDFFFERAAAETASVHLNDGFDRTSGHTDGFPFRSEFFSDRVFRSGRIFELHKEIPSINLVKLHGSLTWRKQDESSICFSLKSNQKPTDEDKANTTKVEELLAKRAVILPNMRKFESALLERVYFDLLRMYTNALDKENALLIVFGFSFADDHILDISKRALRNPTANVIIFSYSSGGAEEFAAKFVQQKNVLIVKPEEGDNIAFSDMNELLSTIIPDAKNTGHE